MRKTERHTEYATERFVKDSLRTIEARYSLPVSQALNYLRQGKVDSISLSKETPYINFHATKLREHIRITVRDGKEDVELELRYSEHERLSSLSDTD